MYQRIFVSLAAALGGLAPIGTVVAPAAAQSAPVHIKVPDVAAVASVDQLAAESIPYLLRCQVTANNVNYRHGPGTQYASYGQLDRGFEFASSGGVPNPHSRLQYWDNIERPGHADAYISDAYVYCWLAH